MFDVGQLAVMNHSDILPVKPDGGSQVEDDQYHHHMVGCLVMILQCQAQGYKQVQTTPPVSSCQGKIKPYGHKQRNTAKTSPDISGDHLLRHFFRGDIQIYRYTPTQIWSIVIFLFSTSRYGHNTVFSVYWGMWRLKNKTFNYHILDLQFFTENN